MGKQQTREKIADYLEKQISKKTEEDYLPDSDTFQSYVSRTSYLEIADGLIPMVKSLLKAENKIG